MLLEKDLIFKYYGNSLNLGFTPCQCLDFQFSVFIKYIPCSTDRKDSKLLPYQLHSIDMAAWYMIDLLLFPCGKLKFVNGSVYITVSHPQTQPF